MVRNSALVLLLFTLVLPLSAQEKIKGNRNVILAENQINAFNKILLSEDFDVVLVESSNASVEIETDENLHDVIKMEVKDSVLTFKTTSKIVSSKKMEIKVRYTSALKEIELRNDSEISAFTAIAGSSMLIKAHDNSRVYLNIRTNGFEFIADGKSKSRLNIESEHVRLELNDNSSLEALVKSNTMETDLYMRSRTILEGSVNELKLMGISSSDLNAKNLTAKSCIVSLEDTSDASVFAEETINIKATGDSDLFLYGNPKITIEAFTDRAKIEKKEL